MVNEKENQNNLDELSENNSEVLYCLENELSIDIPLEDVSSLTESEAQILAQKVEVEIERYENILMQGDELRLSDEELIASGFDEDEYFKLKDLEKEIFKHMKKLRKSTKEGGFFGSMPIWAFAIFIVCALFTIVPVNPYFPIEIYAMLFPNFSSDFMINISGAYLIYFIYIGLFIIVELILLMILFIKGRKAKEKMSSFKSFLVLVIINIIIDIPGLILFLNAASSY